jgi:hypothetical protein
MPATPAAVPAAMTAPAHLFRLEMIDFIAGGDGGMGIVTRGTLIVGNERLRHQRRSPCACNECCANCRKSKGEFQKVPPFHDISFSAI